MRPQLRKLFAFALLLCVPTALITFFFERDARAGGPIAVGGNFGLSGMPFLWDIDGNTGTVSGNRIQYRTDGGTLGNLNNADALARVALMFTVWEDVPSSNIAFNHAGQINSVGAFTDGDVTTAPEFDAVADDAAAGNQTPVVFDATGALFTQLGFSAGVIGFAGPQRLNSAGHILSGLAALNGKFLDGIDGNGELTNEQFNAAFIHEFGHLSGLDHSQVNLNCLLTPATCALGSDDSFGVPTMFPFLLNIFESAGQPSQRTLSPDDVAWISRFYPDPTFSTTHGFITGTVFFTDGVTPAQGVNVIARDEANPRRIASSAVSGLFFTNNLGQPVTGTNTAGSNFGGRAPALIGFFSIPVPAGTYSLEVESVNGAFTGGSSVGPLDPPIPMPGTPPAPITGIVVAAGSTVANQNITILNTRPRFDALEGASNSTPKSPPGLPHSDFAPPAVAILNDRLRLEVRS